MIGRTRETTPDPVPQAAHSGGEGSGDPAPWRHLYISTLLYAI